MNGKLYIDGKDAYAQFGAFLTKGSYASLVQYPPLKKIESNDWQEEDGEEPDLSTIALDMREFSLNFAVHNRMKRAALLELLSDGAYHDFDFRELDRIYRLRLISESGLTLAHRLEKFTLQFADDFPLSGYSYFPPVPKVIQQTGYELDGRDLADYGVRILQGSDAEIQKSPVVKRNLLVNIGTSNGAVYDGDRVTYQSKEVQLNCLMKASFMSQFWRNYDAMLYDLSKSGERQLYVESTGYEYPCYYKSSAVTEFFQDGDVWCSFTLTLVFTYFRVGDDDMLLATEAEELIVTQDGKYTINLREYVN